MTDIKDDGGPAFPIPEQQFSDGVSIVSSQGHYGMSLRDYFAGQALAGLLASPKLRDNVASGAYHYADAMIAAREDKP